MIMFAMSVGAFFLGAASYIRDGFTGVFILFVTYGVILALTSTHTRTRRHASNLTPNQTLKSTASLARMAADHLDRHAKAGSTDINVDELRAALIRWTNIHCD